MLDKAACNETGKYEPFNNHEINYKRSKFIVVSGS
jgi:hypothetical protein